MTRHYNNNTFTKYFRATQKHKVEILILKYTADLTSTDNLSKSLLATFGHSIVETTEIQALINADYCCF